MVYSAVLRLKYSFSVSEPSAATSSMSATVRYLATSAQRAIGALPFTM